jgi:cytochrome c peroxidase
MKIFHTTAAAIFLAGTMLLLANCRKEEQQNSYKYQSDVLNLPEVTARYSNPNLPEHLSILNQKVQSEVNDEVATLGRVLFYDKKLSLTNNIACASCHHQDKGFADPVQFSKGFDGGLTKRNAGSIVNVAQQSSFFWDGRETDLTQMVLQPVKNHIEMGMDNFDVLESKLAKVGYYDELFEQAFGDKAITSNRIATAMDQFLTSMVSGTSKFDRSKPGGWGGPIDPSVFNDSELRGLNLFFNDAGCANCHNPAQQFFFDPIGNAEWADIGLEKEYTDKGVGENNSTMVGLFKIPSLRNVALTGPYMHDGRFETLMDVINHYNGNIQASVNLDWRLRDGHGQPRQMNLNESQKNDLIAFLGTLTDAEFMNDPKFSNPFK